LSELLPFACGIVLGGLLGVLRPSVRLPVGVPLALLLGTLATIVSGELRISWMFLLIDIPLVAISASIGFLIIRRLSPANPSDR
jgi:hypothetical protein